MKTKKDSNNIIDISSDYLTHLCLAKDFFIKESYRDALGEANRALEFGLTSDLALLFMDIYIELGMYEMACNSAAYAMGLFRLNKEQSLAIIQSVPLILNMLNKPYAGLFFISKHGKQLCKDENIFPLDDIQEEMNRLFEIEHQKKSENDLYFTDTQKNEYNRQTFARAIDLVKKKDYDGAIPLLNSIYPGDEILPHAQQLLARCLRTSGKLDAAFEKVKEIFLQDKSKTDILEELTYLSADYAPKVRALLELFEVTDSIKDGECAVYCTEQFELYDLTLKITSELYQKNSNNLKAAFLYAFAENNYGDAQKGRDLLLKTLYASKLRFPVDYVRRMKLPERISLNFAEFPRDLVKKIYRLVLTDIRKCDSLKDNESLKTAIVFLFSNPDNDFEMPALFDWVLDRDKSELADICKKVLCTYEASEELQHIMIDIAVDTFEKGTWLYNNHGYLMDLKFKLPPSYAEFSDELKEGYRFAFAVLSDFDSKFNMGLSKLFEKAFLLEIPLIHFGGVEMAKVICCKLVRKQMQGKFPEFCNMLGYEVGMMNSLIEFLDESLEDPNF